VFSAVVSHAAIRAGGGGDDIAGKSQRARDLRRVAWEFFCKACANEFEADWSERDSVIVCPKCAAAFETGWQMTNRGELVGPWLTNRVQGGTEQA
jgi:hypothetical protein